tara:strand:+ start:1347 stop:1613 length:267 start_codon:yes stop_codon:yes gene_type:complete
MKSYIQGIITGVLIVFSFLVFSGQTNIQLSKKDEDWYKSKGWVRALYDLEMNLGLRIESLSRLLSLEVNDIESDLKLINERLIVLEAK